MNNSVLHTSYFSLSCCVCVFALLNSSMACHKLCGINLDENNERQYVKLASGSHLASWKPIETTDKYLSYYGKKKKKNYYVSTSETLSSFGQGRKK